MVEVQTNELLEPTLEEVVMAGKFTGITEGISNEIYHKAPGLSFTGLKQFAETPATYQAYRRSQKEPTDDQRLGTLVHMFVLEPNHCDTRIAIVDGVWSGKNKEQVAEFRKAGLFPCKSKEVENAKVMADSVLSHPMVRYLFSTGAPEQSCFWQEDVAYVDPKTGEETVETLLCKARPDWLRSEDGIIVDLKWFNDLSERALMKQIYRQRYHWQSAWYLRGVGNVLQKKLNTFVHVFIQEKDPFLSRVVVLNDASLEKGEAEYEGLLPKFVACTKRNEWPGYPNKIETLALPDYAWTDWS